MVTCIIPFYNEKKTLAPLVYTLSQIQEIDQIICVDDGSTDGANSDVQNIPKVLLIKSKGNKGQSHAIKMGLERTINEMILLTDADLVKIKKEEFRNAILTMQEKPIDMLILKRLKDTFIARLSHADVILSGERILKKQDLENIFETNPKGYQLVIAINKYMISQRKAVYWIPHSSLYVHKIHKFGTLRGVVKEIFMGISFIRYVGVGGFLKQLIFFAREEVKR